MKKFQIRSFLIGVFLTILLGSLVTTVFAGGKSKTINVSTGVSMYMDDRQVTPTDANGKPVEVFVYNGTTYIPVRAVSKLFDTPIQWDGKTRGVYIGKHSSTTPAAYLEELEPFTGFNLKCATNEGIVTDNVGTRRNHVLITRNGDNTFDNVYYLNGNYTSMTGTLYQPKEYKNYNYKGYYSSVSIYGDDRLLYEGSVTGGVMPVDFNIDLTGVLKLRIDMNDAKDNWGYGQLCEVALWS